MKNIFCVLIAFLALIGCSSTPSADSPHGESRCEAYEGESRLDCYRKDVATLKEVVQVQSKQARQAPPPAPSPAATAMPTSEPAPTPVVMPEPVAPKATLATRSVPVAPASTATPRPYQVVLVPVINNMCRDGYDLEVENDSGMLIEVQGTNMVICGGDGLVQMMVKTQSGSLRAAYLIPNGVTARFTYTGSGRFTYRLAGYDAPWPDQNGLLVATANGRITDRTINGSSRTGYWRMEIGRFTL